MRKLLYIFVTLFSTLLLTSCYRNGDLNEYTDDTRSNRPDDHYFWYYNPDLFKDIKYCQVIGCYEFVDEYYGYYRMQNSN